MKNIVNTYLDRFRRERHTRIQFILILLALAVMVVGFVFWRLHYTGVALTDAPNCGITEHTHTEDCYVSALICGLEESAPSEGHTHTAECYDTMMEIVCGMETGEGAHTHTDACFDENGELICGLEESEGHIHTADCYESTEVLVCQLEECAPTEGHVHTSACCEKTLVCGLEEHTHTLACMSDENADTETKEDWEATLPDEEERTGVWREDVVTIARSQIGYHESTQNFILDEDGDQKGYTRYGAWYGNAYGDWCAMFASWCIRYAGIEEETFPCQAGCYAWTVQLRDMDLYHDTDYLPQPGDLIFFDNTGDGRANHVGIVEKYEQNGEEIDCETLTAALEDGEITVSDLTLYTIEGNSSDQVKENHYVLTNSRILGYGELPTSEKIYTAEADGVTVTVNAPTGALPEDAELAVTLYDGNSRGYAEAAEAIGADGNLAVLDVSFLANGEEVEPSESVTVCIDPTSILPENAQNVVIRHLEETDAGTQPEVVATLSTPAKAEFEVESFSKFTIEWNDSTGTSIEVHVYDMSGTGFEETFDENYQVSNDVITISDLVAHLQDTGNVHHTFMYATVYYEVTNSMNGYDAYTLGSEENSVVRLTKVLEADGVTVSYYEVTYADNTTARTTSSSTSGGGPGGGTTTGSDVNPELIVIRLYFSVPTVTISVTDGGEENSVSLTAAGEYFQGLKVTNSSVTYTWSLSDSTLGTVAPGDDGTVTFTWADSAKSGDQVTVMVTMTNTYTDDEGNKVIEEASDTYTLTYGEQSVTVTVYQNGSTTATQSGAHVALVDEDGNTVATGITGDDGTVTLYVPDGTYTVGVTYVETTSGQGPSGVARSTGETPNVTVNSGTASASVILGDSVSTTQGSSSATNSWESSTPYYYEHIDVKSAVADTGNEAYSEEFSDLDSVYVYDKYGNLLYTSDNLIANTDTTDYNCTFDLYGTNDEENTHSIIVTSEDTIVITYEVKITYYNVDANGNVVYDDDDGNKAVIQTETKTYTISINADTTYGGDEYYHYTDVNAYQLYNILYSTSYTSQETFETDWEAAAKNPDNTTMTGYNEQGISLKNLGYIQVADYVCDTTGATGATNNQAGLDFVIDVNGIEAIIQSWNFALAKEYRGVPDSDVIVDDEGDQNLNQTFSFTMWEASYDSGTWSYNPDGVSYTAKTDEWTCDDNGVWHSTATFESQELQTEVGTQVYYYILTENGYDNSTFTPEVAYYGIRVAATYEAGGQVSLYVSYFELTAAEEENTFRGTEAKELSADENNIYYLPFVNTYSAGLEIEKQDMYGNSVSGAMFTLKAKVTDESAKADYEEGEQADSETDPDDGNEEQTRKYMFREGTYDEETETWSYKWEEVSEEEYNSGTGLTSFPLNPSVTLEDLINAECVLTETKAPEGYSGLTDPICFKVENGKITGVNTDGSVDEDGNLVYAVPSEESMVIIDGNLTLVVRNEFSAKIPDTGGIGTIWYTTAGLLLITGTAYLLYKNTRKERGSRKD